MLVNSNAIDEEKTLIKKYVGEYWEMSEQQTRANVATNVRAVQEVLREAADQYDTEGLEIMAQVYRESDKYLDVFMAIYWKTFDTVGASARKHGYVGLGVMSEVCKWGVEREMKRRTESPLTVTDTEEVLNEKLTEIAAKILTVIKTTVDEDFHEKETKDLFMFVR